jgi:hypothetical protein
MALVGALLTAGGAARLAFRMEPLASAERMAADRGSRHRIRAELGPRASYLLFEAAQPRVIAEDA